MAFASSLVSPDEHAVLDFDVVHAPGCLRSDDHRTVALPHRAPADGDITSRPGDPPSVPSAPRFQTEAVVANIKGAPFHHNVFTGVDIQSVGVR